VTLEGVAIRRGDISQSIGTEACERNVELA